VEKNSSPDLSHIPSVEKVKKTGVVVDLLSEFADGFVTDTIREVIDEIRAAHKTGKADLPSIELDDVAGEVARRIRARLLPPLRRVVNGTGIIVHTNLGRSILGDRTVAAIADAARHYCDVEIDLPLGERGHRDAILEPLLCAITGAEAATIVNNNAAAVMIALDTFARGGEVVVSRGELVEIGGSFRIPDVMEKSGAKLIEVGTTNRTYIADYERALSPETALLLKVHQSNYHIIGFTHETGLSELVQLGQKRGIPVMEDLGSGAFIDISRYGLDSEPMPQASIKAGADIVTFSGDKLLGGPQAGIILGKSEYVKAIRKNPLMRAFRVDKLTLSALGMVFQTMLSSPAPEREIPTLGMMARSVDDISGLIENVRSELGEETCHSLGLAVIDGESQVGGGSCPGQAVPTKLLLVNPKGKSPDKLAAALRQGTPSVLGIIRDDSFCLDFRTVQADELHMIADALRKAINH
jgi:L-seryl-tRNA(Ser) seleniumtransferase